MLTGLFCLRKGGPVYLWLILFIISIAYINQAYIVPNAEKWWGIHPNICYNIYSVVENVAWFAFYYTVFNKKIKQLILVCAIANIICSAIEFFITGTPVDFHQYAYIAFSLTALLLSLLYIFKVSLRDHHLLSRDPVFFICCASVCFHSIFFLNLVTIFDPVYWRLADAVYIYETLQSFASCMYYILLCISFIIFSYRPKNFPTPRSL
jgi:hypothetical protein